MPAARGIFSTLVAFLQLGKLRLSALAVLAVVAGLYMGHPISPPLSLALVVALTVLITTAYCSGRFPEVPAMVRNGRWILAIMITQLILGFVALAVRTGKDPSNIHSLGSSALISSHVVVGSVLVLMCAVLMLRSFRNLEAGDPHIGDAVTPEGMRPR